jgi:hypothetical protein
MKGRHFMNPKIKKTRDELERTKAKIIELQALVPQLERSITDMENADIIKAVRSADISLADLPAFIASLKRANAAPSTAAEPQTGTNDGAYANSGYSDDLNENNEETLDEEDDANA